MAQRTLPSILLATTLAAASGLALGRPDLPGAAQFLAGGDPNLESAVATASLLCYSLVAAVTLTAIAQTLRAATAVHLAAPRSSRAAMFLIVGVLVMTLAVLHRTSAHTVAFCCGGSPGDIEEAASLAR